MALTREDLEKRDGWLSDGARHDGRHYHQIDQLGYFPQPRTICDTLSRDPSIEETEDDQNAMLLSAAPQLALACLKADEYADMMERGEQVRMGETLRLRKILRAALEAAGVEVEP